MKEIYVFRHGETDWNKAGRMQGHADIPLNETGRQQAVVLREYFAKHPVEVFLCSDLGRAMETAEIARGALDVPIVHDARQRETHLGSVEGRTREEIASSHGDAFEKWVSFPDDWSFGFPGGETKQQHLDRVKGALIDFLSKTPYAKIGLSSHGGSMRRLLHSLRPDVLEPINVGNCFLYKLDYTHERGLWVDDLNPLSHV